MSDVRVEPFQGYDKADKYLICTRVLNADSAEEVDEILAYEFSFPNGQCRPVVGWACHDRLNQLSAKAEARERALQRARDTLRDYIQRNTRTGDE